MLLALSPVAASAESLVLVQGYLGDADNWRDSGITRSLQQAGWGDGGELQWSPQGIRAQGARVAAGRSFYTLDLPTEAPLTVQLGYLERYLEFIRLRHAGESIILVGHSAGGVLARLYMVQHPDAGVAALVTIASPNLGTESAELGIMAGQSPLAMLAPMLGVDTLNRSQGLFHDLARERPGSLLYWLNRQQHPSATYVSIVRSGDDPSGMGDLVVPGWSQDLNGVLALRGRARSLTVGSDHALGPDDAKALVGILRSLQRS